MESSERRIAPTRKAFSASFSQFLRPRPNLSNAGWLRSVMNAYRKLKTPNWPRKEQKRFIGPKAIPTIGLKSECAGLLFGQNSPMNGKCDKSDRKGNTPF